MQYHLKYGVIQWFGNPICSLVKVANFHDFGFKLGSLNLLLCKWTNPKIQSFFLLWDGTLGGFRGWGTPRYSLLWLLGEYFDSLPRKSTDKACLVSTNHVHTATNVPPYPLLSGVFGMFIAASFLYVILHPTPNSKE